MPSGVHIFSAADVDKKELQFKGQHMTHETKYIQINDIFKEVSQENHSKEKSYNDVKVSKERNKTALRKDQ